LLVDVPVVSDFEGYPIFLVDYSGWYEADDGPIDSILEDLRQKSYDRYDSRINSRIEHLEEVKRTGYVSDIAELARLLEFFEDDDKYAIYRLEILVGAGQIGARTGGFGVDEFTFESILKGLRAEYSKEPFPDKIVQNIKRVINDFEEVKRVGFVDNINAIARLLKLLENKDKYVRRKAIYRLSIRVGQVGLKEAGEHTMARSFINALNDDYEYVRNHAVSALAILIRITSANAELFRALRSLGGEYKCVRDRVVYESWRSAELKGYSLV